MSTTLVTSRSSHKPLRSMLRQLVRFASTEVPTAQAIKAPANKPTLSRMSNRTLLRSAILMSLMSSPRLLQPALSIFGLVATSKSRLLNPDTNPVLNRLMRWTIYDHFCAGSTSDAVSSSVTDFKKMGFHGVILGNAKEILLEDPDEEHLAHGSAGYTPACFKMIDKWKQANLATLLMIGEGDFIAIKLTGAGPIAVDAIRERRPIPVAVQNALDEICQAVRNQGSRLWVDAEQQVLQKGIDQWTIELMRKYNRGGNIFVYNTIQAYLKGAHDNLDHHIACAAEEGWALGIKLVRGAYIEHEVRSLIHDTKDESDLSYDLCADKLLCQKMPAGYGDLPFPTSALFLATHNEDSVNKAVQTHRNRISSGSPTITLECGQIVGMADKLSFDLVRNYEDCKKQSAFNTPGPPKVFKCMTWGTVGECMGFLHRRAIENRGAVERTQAMAKEMWREVRRRWAYRP